MKISIMLLYFLSIVIIGWAAVRAARSKTEEDFALSTREHGWFAIACSTFASGCSAFAFVGMAGLSYKVGIAMLWYSLLATTWSWATFFVIGKRLRLLSERFGSVTIVDYIAHRFGDSKGVLRIIGTAIVLIFMMGYVAAQFKGMAKAFEGFLGWPIVLSTVIGAIIVIAYTFFSGFRGVVWTDVMQTIVMLVGSLLFTIFAIAKAGGLNGFLTMASTIDPKFVSITGGKTGLAFITFLLAWVGSGMMGIGNPHIAVRPMAMKDPRKMREAGVFALVANMWVMYLGVFAGLAARVYLPEIADVDLAYAMVIDKIMPAILGSIIIAGIVAATMSTSDSQLLVAATETTKNFYLKYINPTAGEYRKLWVTRVSVVIIGAVALFFALKVSQIVFWMVLFAWAGAGCAFGPLLILSLWWKRMTWAGALAGMLAGTITVIIWNQTPALKGFIYEGVPGFIVAFIAIWVVSLLTYPPKEAEEYMKFDS